MRIIIALFLLYIGGHIVSLATPPDFIVPWELVCGLWIAAVVIAVPWRKANQAGEGMAGVLQAMIRPAPRRIGKVEHKPVSYPRIVGGDGVWAGEINDFDIAIVQTSETSFTYMVMEDAKARYPDVR